MSEDRKTAGIEGARARLYEWGSCVRAVTAGEAPNVNMYNRSTFYNPRVNFEQRGTVREMFQGERFRRGTEIDELLIPIHESNPKTWAALWIRYVLRDQGGRRKLRQDDQIKTWKKRTEMGKWSYFARLRRAEEYIAMSLGGG